MFVVPVIVACLSSGQCQEFSGQYMTQTQCLFADQILRSDFERQHPEFRVASLKCRPVSRRDEA